MCMAEITVRAEQRTVDWDEGAVFTVERTDYVDKLIADGRVTQVAAAGGSIVDGLITAYEEVEPPRSGKGSGADVWRNFLDHHGVNYDQTDNRDDLVELWENHQFAQAEADAESAAEES